MRFLKPIGFTNLRDRLNERPVCCQVTSRNVERGRRHNLPLNAPRRACVREDRSMTLRQGLLAALLALAMMGSMSAGRWVVWDLAVRCRARP